MPGFAVGIVKYGKGVLGGGKLKLFLKLITTNVSLFLLSLPFSDFFVLFLQLFYSLHKFHDY